MIEDVTYKKVSNQIDEWLGFRQDEWFRRENLWAHFGLSNRPDNAKWKHYIAVKLNNEVVAGVLEKNNDKFRLVDKSLDEIHWQDLTGTETLDIKYPLGLEKFVKTYPKSPIIIAAPPGWGKTAFLMNCALLNMNYPQGVYVWSNDLTGVELYERLSNSGFEIPNPAPFKIFERSNHFGDVVGMNPDAIHIIDYLDLNQDLFMVGKEIDDIYHKLGNGVAFIGIQRNPFNKSNDYGYGGVFSAKRAKLYLSIDTKREMGRMVNTLKIVKARGWADKTFNPNGQVFNFSIRNGIQLNRLNAEEQQEEVEMG